VREQLERLKVEGDLRPARAEFDIEHGVFTNIEQHGARIGVFDRCAACDIFVFELRIASRLFRILAMEY
jgi:hypothetical protein